MIPQRRASRSPRERIVTNCLLYQNVGELQHVIKQSAKERLLLERQVAQLHQAAKLQKERSERELRVRLRDVEERLKEQESQLTQLQKELDDRCEIGADLERQLLEALEQKIEVEAQNATLEEQLERLRAESESERLRCAAELQLETEKASALESLVVHLRQAADQRRLLERQHAQALEEVRVARATAATCTGTRADATYLHTIQGLESKATSTSDRTCSLELADTLLLNLDSTSSPMARGGARSASPPPRVLDSTGADYLTGPSLTCSSVLTVYFESEPTSPALPERGKKGTEMSLSRSTTTSTSATREVDRILARIQQDNRVLAELEKSRATIGSPVSVANLERLRHSIEAGAEKQSHSAAGQESSVGPSLASLLLQSQLKSSFSSPAIDQLSMEPHRTRQLYSQLRSRALQRSTISIQELDGLMAKLEQDNRILAELDKKRACLGSSCGMPSRFCASSEMNAALTFSGSHSALAPVAASRPSLSGSRCTAGLTLPTLPVGQPPNGVLGVTSPLSRLQHHAAITPTPRQDSHSMAALAASTSQQLQQHGPEEDSLGVESVEFLDLPGRGRCRVYAARYSYDPLKQSPNEHPEAELCLSAGDYILIFGDMDEDGFFNGELMDGRKGLVPSNFVEKLTGEDLFEFQTTILYGNRDSDDSSASFSYAPDLDALVGSEDQHRLPPEDLHRMNDYIDLEDIEEVDEDALSETERENDGMGLGGSGFPVPPPQRLVLERQLNKSVLIGWLPPDVVLGSLEAYHVYVDGVLKATVRAGHRTRALLEGVDSSQPHRISVRSVLSTGQHSRDAACTIVIGKNVPLAPSCVKASNVTSTSCTISWLPSNSNFSHVVAVNSVEMKSLKPGTFRHLVSGLAPNTSYRVSVRAKPGRLLLCGAPEENKTEPRKMAGMLTAFVDFRTLPKGIPDPPVDIQVEAGPQDGTVLVTWLPVTINAAGTSNGTPVTGYAVYAAGRKLTEIDSPTGDHALLEVGPLLPLHTRAVTVRTKAGDSLSADSLPCIVPDDLLHGTRTAKSADRMEENHSELSDIVEELEDEMIENGEMGHRGSRVSRSGASTSPRKHHHHHHHHPHHQQQQPSQQPPQQQQQQFQHGPPHQVQQPPPQHQPVMPVSQMHHPSGGHREKRNSAGQLIIDPDDALSDKEIYPYYRSPSIPPIDMSKESEGSCMAENYSEEEFSKYEMGHRGSGPRASRPGGGSSRYHQHHHGSGGGGPPTAYQERSRPSSPTPPSRSRDPMDDDRPYRSYPRPQTGRSGGHRQVLVRMFRALFDYDPQSMSPNPDTADEELPFRAGDYIKIYGVKDQDGFYKGECHGRVGFVPCNMVSEVTGDPDMADASPAGGRSRAPPPHHRGVDGEWGGGGVLPPQPKRMVALYDYDPAELSPNPDPFNELAFSTGDVIYVYGGMDEDGFYYGELHGLRGLVPSNFLADAPADYTEGHSQRRSQQHAVSMQGKEIREPVLASQCPRDGRDGREGRGVSGPGPGGHPGHHHTSQPAQSTQHPQQHPGGSQRGHGGVPPGTSVPQQGPPPRHAPEESLQWQQHQHQQQQQHHQSYQQHQQHRGGGGPPTTMEAHYDHRGSDHRGYAGRPVVAGAQRW